MKHRLGVPHLSPPFHQMKAHATLQASSMPLLVPSLVVAPKV